MRPVVLCFSGHDPSGGAGIQADIEAITANGARAQTVITAITSQNTQGVNGFQAISADWLKKQTAPLIEESRPDAIKIGMVASVENVLAIIEICQSLAHVPVIFDPVLAAGSKGNLAQSDIVQAIRQLIPYTTIITPNQAELTKVDPKKQAKNILLTTTDSSNETTITHHWHGQNSRHETYTYPRLAAKYHGSGCTLASSLSAYLASNIPLEEAIPKALDYTWATLKNAEPSSLNQLLPKRL